MAVRLEVRQLRAHRDHAVRHDERLPAARKLVFDGFRDDGVGHARDVRVYREAVVGRRFDHG